MTNESEHKFGPFKVREATPKALAPTADLVELWLSDAGVALIDNVRGPIGKWRRDEVTVDARSDFYGCIRLGEASVWVNTAAPKVLQKLHDAVSGEVGGIPESALAQDARQAFSEGLAVVVRAYPGRTQSDAAELFQRDAEYATEYGHSPTAQSWSEGRAGIGRVVMIGFYSLIFKPKGFLSVTYTRSLPLPTPLQAASTLDATKTCPMCAEDVKAAAKICRFCRYEFP